MELFKLIEGKYKVISVVGMAKNAGKTVTLNELISSAKEKNVILGITSIGRDGERQDVVTKTDKPLIYVHAGTIIASAEKLMDISDAGLEILKITDVSTPLGRIVIARVIRPGYTQIAGPSTNSDIVKVSNDMIELGTDLVIVDGALDRVSSASPAVTEGVILSTGAVLSRDMNKVIAETAHKVSLFSLPKLDVEGIVEIATESFQSKSVVIVNEIDGKLIPEIVPIKTALSAGGIIGRFLNESSKYIIIPGSLVTKTMTDMLQASDLLRHVTIVVSDATKIFIPNRDWMHFSKSGINVAVIDEIKLIAVTINPYAPSGYFFDPPSFSNSMRACLEGIKVFDVLGGEYDF